MKTLEEALRDFEGNGVTFLMHANADSLWREFIHNPNFNSIINTAMDEIRKRTRINEVDEHEIQNQLSTMFQIGMMIALDMQRPDLEELYGDQT